MERYSHAVGSAMTSRGGICRYNLDIDIFSVFFFHLIGKFVCHVGRVGVTYDNPVFRNVVAEFIDIF